MPKSKKFQVAKWNFGSRMDCVQHVLGTADTHKDAWELVCKDLMAMHEREPDKYPEPAKYTKIEPKSHSHFEFSDEKPFAIYSYPKKTYSAGAVAHALNWRYNTEARSCFEYMPSFARRQSWDSEDEAEAKRQWEEE